MACSKIVNSVIQNIYYEQLNLLSELFSKFYTQLHLKVGISHSFRLFI